MDLLSHWDGQPVRFVCCERAKGKPAEKSPWGKVLFCVAMEKEEEDVFEKATVSYRP